MIALVTNLALAILMANLLSDNSVTSVLAFMVVAFFMTWPFRHSFGPSDYHGRIQRVFGLIGFFLYDLVVSSFKVAYDVVTPPLLSRPKFLVMPLDATTDAEIMLTANLISLTPGSLSVDISADRKSLLVHTMFAGQSAEQARASLKDGMERRVIEALR
ncbi:sodium:proton antiporter [Litorivicinus lipolyticus]|uniref:Sodium:proton antiporter n=1 Tax=Litorivicinus lipolyticus TaxID=418701 RepID=A0A5Q2QAU4_9GAMM|nr:Na+/H+ antiporter subunit E [Litorivicinus lipolyticus]QGG79372.1 sodium:proton antiporter [Litorivicinus lipolyticus]